MAKRKKEPERRQEVSEPFNNPFGASFRALRKKARKDVESRPPSPQPPAPARQRDEAPHPLDDRTRFLAAVSDAKPLVTSGERVKQRPEGADHGVVVSSQVELDLASAEHFDVRFSDRFIRASAAGVSRETVAKLERGEFAVRSHVDLHGMALDDARCVVDRFLAERQRHGERCVLVITGKGRNSRQQVGVLREKIPEWLARGPSARRVLAFVTARPCDGGEGALYVLLRKHAASKARIDIIAGGGA